MSPNDEVIPGLEVPPNRDDYFDGLVQERRNSIANALELRLSCTNPSIYEMQPCASWGKATGRMVI